MSLNPSKKLSRTSWQKTEVPLFPKVSVASTFAQRARGLLGTRPKPELLMIAPCHSIHTFGMRYPIHIAFFDACGNVITAETSVPPGTKRSCPHAVGVLEMPALYPASQWFISGDSLRLAPPDAYHRT